MLEANKGNGDLAILHNSWPAARSARSAKIDFTRPQTPLQCVPKRLQNSHGLVVIEDGIGYHHTSQGDADVPVDDCLTAASSMRHRICV